MLSCSASPSSFLSATSCQGGHLLALLCHKHPVLLGACVTLQAAVHVATAISAPAEWAVQRADRFKVCIAELGRHSCI